MRWRRSRKRWPRTPTTPKRSSGAAPGPTGKPGRRFATEMPPAPAMADMDRARALAPRSIGVLIPRGAVLLAAARGQPDPARARELAARAAADYETALTLRQTTFAGLGLHNRGEYLSGLAEAWAIAGEREKSETYLRRILAELPNSPYAERAAAKLGDWGDGGALTCQPCH